MRRNTYMQELNSLNATRKARKPQPLSAEALAAQEYVRKVIAERVASRTLPAAVLAKLGK
jgi:hypothetical protein